MPDRLRQYMSNRTPSRRAECHIACQMECQNICQIECQVECQHICQETNLDNMSDGNICQIKCPKGCQIECPPCEHMSNRMPDRMSEQISCRMSFGGDHSEKAFCSYSFLTPSAKIYHFIPTLRADFGVKASRRRYYFWMVHREALADKCSSFASTIDSTLAALKSAMGENSIPWPEAQSCNP